MTDELFEILTAPRTDRKYIKKCIEQINDLRISMLPSAIRYDKDRIQSSPSDPMINFAEKVEELEDTKKYHEQRYIEDYNKADELIRELKNADLETVMTLKYLACNRNREIARKMNYSESTVEKLHKKAIGKLEETLR